MQMNPNHGVPLLVDFQIGFSPTRLRFTGYVVVNEM